MHYYRTGGVKPPLVLIHGLADSGLCWSRVALELEPEYDLIMVDLRGHGLSGGGDDISALDASVSDIFELIQSLELGKVILVGHSLGANIAALTARRFPDMVLGLVLEDPPWFSDDTMGSAPDADAIAAGWIEHYKRWKSMSYEALYGLLNKLQPAWDDDDKRQWIKAKQQLRREFINYVEPQPFNWKPVIATMKTRTLILAGNPDKGGLLSMEAIEVIHKQWKAARIVAMPEAGHNVRRDDPQKYLGEMKNFLQGFPVKNGGFR